MSVIFSHTARTSRLRQMWPLALFLLLATAAGIWLCLAAGLAAKRRLAAGVES